MSITKVAFCPVDGCNRQWRYTNRKGRTVPTSKAAWLREKVVTHIIKYHFGHFL